jgi:hypothetical protein
MAGDAVAPVALKGMRLLLVLAAFSALAACGPLQPASGLPTYNEQGMGGSNSGA